MMEESTLLCQNTCVMQRSRARGESMYVNGDGDGGKQSTRDTKVAWGVGGGVLISCIVVVLRRYTLAFLQCRPTSNFPRAGRHCVHQKGDDDQDGSKRQRGRRFSSCAASPTSSEPIAQTPRATTSSELTPPAPPFPCLLCRRKLDVLTTGIVRMHGSNACKRVGTNKERYLFYGVKTTTMHDTWY